MTDEWGIERLDLAAYLNRIGRPSGDVSWKRCTGCTRRMCWRSRSRTSTSSSARIPVSSSTRSRPSSSAATRRLLLRARAAVRRRARDARLRGRAPGRAGPAAQVRAEDAHAPARPREGQELLADVGFGAGILHPMPLKDGAVVDQGGWEHRLTRRRRHVDPGEEDRRRLDPPARLERRAATPDRLRGLPPLRRDPPALAVHRPSSS